MSRRHDRSDEQNGASALGALAVAATVGAILVGAAALVKDWWGPEEVVETTNMQRGAASRVRINRGRDDGPQIRDGRNFGKGSATQSDLDRAGLTDWLAFMSTAKTADVDTENDALMCKVCMHKEVAYVLQCGHMLCGACAVNQLKASRQCPFDRQEITRAPQKVFL